jgi:hypothetical protein
VAVEDLTGEVAERFVADRRQRYRRRASGRALEPLLVYLRGVGAVPEPDWQVDDRETAAAPSPTWPPPSTCTATH